MANLKSIIFSLLCSTPLLTSNDLLAQVSEPKLSRTEMAITIDSINTILLKNYVFPAVAHKMAQSLSSKLKTGKYNGTVVPAQFAEQLTKDLQSVSNDKHLRVVYDPAVIATEKNAIATNDDRAKADDEWIKEMRAINFGFQEVKIMERNVGYLDLREFADPKYAGETATSAMNFLSNVDALIVDLRHNGGGMPAMVQLITSYFFSAEPVHLTDFYHRPTNETTQSWTLPFVPGTRRPDVDLYVLTSKTTFSAAEEFCYNLKNLKRATLIGETTAGGAHRTGSVIATDNFYVRVPKGRAINPITNANWEGTGVTPDIRASSEDALKIAYAKAIERLKRN